MSETREEYLENKSYHRRKDLLEALEIRDLLDLIDDTKEVKEWLVEYIIENGLDNSVKE